MSPRRAVIPRRRHGFDASKRDFHLASRFSLVPRDSSSTSSLYLFYLFWGDPSRLVGGRGQLRQRTAVWLHRQLAKYLFLAKNGASNPAFSSAKISAALLFTDAETRLN